MEQETSQLPLLLKGLLESSKSLAFPSVNLWFLGSPSSALSGEISRFLAVVRPLGSILNKVSRIWPSPSSPPKQSTQQIQIKEGQRKLLTESHIFREGSTFTGSNWDMPTLLTLPGNDRSLQPYHLLAFTLLAERQSKRPSPNLSYPSLSLLASSAIARTARFAEMFLCPQTHESRQPSPNSSSSASLLKFCTSPRRGSFGHGALVSVTGFTVSKIWRFVAFRITTRQHFL